MCLQMVASPRPVQGGGLPSGSPREGGEVIWEGTGSACGGRVGERASEQASREVGPGHFVRGLTGLTLGDEGFLLMSQILFRRLDTPSLDPLCAGHGASTQGWPFPLCRAAAGVSLSFH